MLDASFDAIIMFSFPASFPLAEEIVKSKLKDKICDIKTRTLARGHKMLNLYMTANMYF